MDYWVVRVRSNSFERFSYLAITAEALAQKIWPDRGDYTWDIDSVYAPRVIWFEDEADAAAIVVQLDGQYDQVGVEKIQDGRTSLRWCLHRPIALRLEAAYAAAIILAKNEKFPWIRWVMEPADLPCTT